ncbi:MAG: O-antigen ligase family protein [Syntrophales bacterium]|jgi:O-antigen ligase
MDGILSLSEFKKQNLFELLNRFIPILIAILIFLNPYPHVTAIKEISFYGSVVILLTLFFLRKRGFSLRTPLSIPFALFVFWSFITIFFALNKENSIHDFCAHLLKYLAIYYLLTNYFQTKKQFVCLVWIVISSVTLFSLGGMIYFYLILGHRLTERFGFVVMSINYIGFATVFAIILSLQQFSRETKVYLRCILVTCLSCLVSATLLTQTRGAIIALLFSSVVLFIRDKKRMIISFLTICIALIMIVMLPGLENRFDLNYMLSSERVAVNVLYMEAIKDHPIMGTGFGMQLLEDKNFLDAYNAKVPVKFRQEVPVASAHNLLTDVTVRLGLIGLALYMYILFSFFRTDWLIIKYGKDDFIRSWGLCLLASLLSALIQGMFANAYFGMQAIYSYTIFAMMTIIWHLNIRTDTQIKLNPADI